jgi:transposase
MKDKSIYVGLDVHKNDIEVALAHGGRKGLLLPYGRISNDLHSIDRLISKLRRKHPGSSFYFVYEAGPCGFVLYRYLARKRADIDCIVVAPSRIPKKSGDKVKTDRRDALMLARLHRSGELESIHIPDSKDEAIRDMCRARTDSRKDLQAARFRLKAFLLRNGYRYPLKTAWTARHMHYLRELTLEDVSHKVILEESLLHIDAITERIERYNQMIETVVKTWRWQPVVQALQAMRGIKLLTATVIVSELGDIRRFTSVRQLMSFLGLTTTEYSSGDKRQQGAISKAGNSHARSFLVESAQHYKRSPQVGQNLSRRQLGVPAPIKEIAWNAQVRLHKRYWALLQRGKNHNRATVAIAREMTGFIWDIYRKVPLENSISTLSH